MHWSSAARSNVRVNTCVTGYSVGSNPKQRSTAVAGFSFAATLPDGVVVSASDLQPVVNHSNDGGVNFRYQVQYTNNSDQPVNVSPAVYAMHVEIDGVSQPCSKITGPPDMMPLSGVVRPGQKASGWVGTGCPSGASTGSSFVLDIAQHEELSPAVEFGP